MRIPYNQVFSNVNVHIKADLEDFFRMNYGMDKIYFTTSCSSALQMAAEIIDIKEGDEIILPSFSYVTTAMGFYKRGAKLIFADIDPETYVLDLEDVKGKITDRTKAIVPVHYAGVSLDMDRLSDIIKGKKIYVIEDAAQGIHAKYKDRYLGAIGDIGTYSFHSTKNISTGEGGILSLNNKSLMDRANVVFEKGTDRQAFINGEIDHYSWKDIGGSYEMSDYLKMILFEQLGKIEFIQKERERVYLRYMKNLQNSNLQLPKIPKYSKSNYHIFAILLEDFKKRNEVIKSLKSDGIQTTFHYQPLHDSKFGEKMGYSKFALPTTVDVASRILRLPIYPDLTNDMIDEI